MSGSQPPFDPLSFNPRDLPKELLVEWSRDPPMFLDKPGHPTQYDAKNRVEYVKRMVAVYVSPAVFALGKDPYPGLRENRYIPELRTTTPIYRDTRPWMGSNYLLMHITPKELQKLGCINLETNDSSEIEISPRFQIDTTVLATASTDRSVVNTIGNNDGIHSVFRRSNWKETSNAEYEHLKPVLRIATEMMAMEGFLDLWTALGQPLQRLPQNNMLLRQNEQHRVYYTGKTSPGQRGRTQQEMLGLCNYVTYSWEHDDDLAAVTTAIASERGLRPGPFRNAANIEIDSHFRYIICRGGTEFNASYYNPTASDASSYMRTQLHLATALVHELTHAWFLNVTDEYEDLMPFRNDDRISEEGFAAETVIHKDFVLDVMEANFMVRTSPFGMRANRWPGVSDSSGDLTKASAARHGIKFHTTYAIPMSYVHQFFLDDFWSNRVLRFGDGAISGYKAVGIRWSLVNKLNFDPSEHGMIKRKLNPDTGLWEEDPEIDPDAEFPDVYEGIVYKDKVLTLMGEEMADSDEEMKDVDKSDDDDGSAMAV